MIAFYTRFKTTAENRTKLAAVLARESGAMSTVNGCRLYNVSLDVSDPTIIDVTEFWTDESTHEASLGTPEAKALIAEAMPLIVEKPQQAKLGQVITHWL